MSLKDCKFYKKIWWTHHQYNLSRLAEWYGIHQKVDVSKMKQELTLTSRGFRFQRICLYVNALTEIY